MVRATDSTGDPTSAHTERNAYDPWGRHRLIGGGDDATCGATPASKTTRGYTGHEQLNDLCLVNANARIYDPTIARFMMPDTLVSDVTNLQNWNPYTYVNNRPMTLTDPTGHEGCNASLCGTGNSATNYQASNAAQLSSDLSSVSIFESDGSEPTGIQFGMSVDGKSTVGTTGLLDAKNHLIPGTAKRAAAAAAGFGFKDGTSAQVLSWAQGLFNGGAGSPANFKDSYTEVHRRAVVSVFLGELPGGAGALIFADNWKAQHAWDIKYLPEWYGITGRTDLDQIGNIMFGYTAAAFQHGFLGTALARASMTTGVGFDALARLAGLAFHVESSTGGWGSASRPWDCRLRDRVMATNAAMRRLWPRVIALMVRIWATTVC